MPIPLSQRAIFDRNVLSEVVCQLRFPTILSIASADPAQFQDRVRTTYPLYHRESTVEVPPEIRELIADLPISGGGQSVRHVFATANQKRAISLASDFLAVAEKSYTRWEAFGPEILNALTALNELYRPAFLSRVGLRYRDVIDRSVIPGFANAPWRALINPILMGPMGEGPFREEIEATQATVILNLDEVAGAKARIHHGTGKIRQSGQIIYFFDVDFSISENTELANVEHILDAFHRASGNLFRWAITPALHEALGPRPI